MRITEATLSRLWAVGLGLLCMAATLLILRINPFEVALAYLGLLAAVMIVGLMTGIWGGLAASALTVFAVVMFGHYAGIYLRETARLNAAVELTAILLVGPLAGGLNGAIQRLQRQADHWLAQAAELAVHDKAFGTLKPEWAKVRLEEEVLRAVRFARPLSVVVVHLVPQPGTAADNRTERVAALQAVVRVARSVIQPPCVVAHAGGDQLLLILPEYTIEQVQDQVATLTGRLEHEVYFPPGQTSVLGKPIPQGHKRVSQWGAPRVGIASLTGPSETSAELLSRARAALEM